MRIAFVSTRSDTIGGSNVHIRDLALALRALGHDAHVLGGGDGSWAARLRDDGVPYHPIASLQREIRPGLDARALLELRAALRVLSPELVSLHTAKAGFVGRLAALGLGAPVLYTPHGWAFTPGVPRGAARRYALLERLVAPLAARIVNVCAFEREIALARGVGGAARHVVVHNGMPDVDERLRARPERTPPTLVMVARFEEQKDHALLLQALAACRELPWTLELVGSGPLEGAARERSAALGLDARVRFLGTRHDVAEVLAHAQAFVLASHWEGFPRSILEAMRAGLPVVASAVGGAHESVADGVTGRLVPPGDERALAAALREVLADPERRAAFGRAGRARYEAAFTFERMLSSTLEVYRSLAPSAAS